MSARAAGVLGMAILGLAMGCGGSASSPPPSLVVLVSLDTLRKDAVGIYGEKTAATTPALDRFAEDAVRIDGARTPIPFTLSAHMSLFTGLSPRVHGVRKPPHRLSESIPTMAELLRSEGFSTHGIAVNYWMKGDFGFERGFDSYELVRESLRSGARVSRAALEIVDEHELQKAPLFLFLQFFDAHSASSEIISNTLPYYSSSELRTDVAPHRSDPTFCDPESGCATGYLMGANAGRTSVSPATLATIRELYRRSVRDLDRHLSIFFDGLRERGLYDDALIIVTSDHGEEFREHGMFLHQQTYDEILAVPLLIKFPSGRDAGRRIETLVGLMDILPTVLDELGLPTPELVQGRSLLPAINDGVAVRDALIGHDKGKKSRFALIEEDAKLIFDFRSEEAELYDLRADPLEATNLAKASPERVEVMRRRLVSKLLEHDEVAARLRPEPAPPTEPVLSDAERAALRALGYEQEAEER